MTSVRIVLSSSVKCSSRFSMFCSPLPGGIWSRGLVLCVVVTCKLFMINGLRQHLHSHEAARKAAGQMRETKMLSQCLLRKK